MSMKNNQAMNLSQLAATGTTLDLVVADVQGQVKFTKLAPAKPRKADLRANRVGGASTRWSPAARAPRDGGSRLKAGAARVN